MNAQEFCYWLQGLMEGANPKTLDEKQVTMVKEHLNLVFTKVTETAWVLGDLTKPLMGKRGARISDALDKASTQTFCASTESLRPRKIC